jgi:two-component system sensor histidine kinase KdpD
LVRGDASQLQRVLVNLIENGLKFSPTGASVRVEVAQRGGFVDIAVVDRGPGVPDEEAERIFEPFHRGAAQRDVPGSGLGLAIARGLAAANGCRLTIEQAGGGGSRFLLRVPVPATGKPA